MRPTISVPATSAFGSQGGFTSYIQLDWAAENPACSVRLEEHSCSVGKLTVGFIVRLAAQSGEINPELFRFLVQMAAFEAERPGSFGDLIVVPFQFGEDYFALETLHAIGEAARKIAGSGVGRRRLG